MVIMMMNDRQMGNVCGCVDVLGVTNHLPTMDEYGCGWVCQLTTVGNIWLVCLLGVLYFVNRW